jgi:hypothetical protein
MLPALADLLLRYPRAAAVTDDLTIRRITMDDRLADRQVSAEAISGHPMPDQVRPGCGYR